VAASRHGNTPNEGIPITPGSATPYTTSVDANAIGLDEGTSAGSLVIQHYLAATSAERAPLMWLRAQADEPWFSRYLAQCEACLTTAREWQGSSALPQYVACACAPNPGLLRPAVRCVRPVLVA
jgi:hypothetical protein